MKTLFVQISILSLGLQFHVNMAEAFFNKEKTELKPILQAVVNPFSNFEELTKCTTFVDKTLLIHKFFNVSGSRQFHLITCPHKFGRSTNLDMMKRFLQKVPSYLKDSARNLWQNLKISQFLNDGSTLDNHFQRYNVIKISFKFPEANTLDNVLLGIRQVFKSIHQSYMEKKKDSYMEDLSVNIDDLYSEDDMVNALVSIFNKLGQFNEIFCLIEDYDDPILKAIEYNFDVIRVTELMRKLFSRVLSSETKIKYALITGSLNVFDGTEFPYIMHWNFLENHPFVQYFGFTADEVDHLFNHHSVNENGKNITQHYYDGYSVSNSPIRIYNPHSIVRYLSRWYMQNSKLENHWADAKPILTFLPCFHIHSKYRKIIHNLLELEQIKFTLKQRWNFDDLEKLRNTMHNGSCNLTARRVDMVLSYLFYNGYLSYGDEPDTYRLPNKEIKNHLNKSFTSEDKSIAIDENELKSRLFPHS